MQFQLSNRGGAVTESRLLPKKKKNATGCGKPEHGASWTHLRFCCRAAIERHPENLLRNETELHFVFGSCALQALDLVDQRSVTCVSSPSGRKVFQVLGGSGRQYTCFTSCLYCPCPAYSFTVLRRNDSLMCKHLLAACLCQAMGLCQQEQVSDQQMTHILAGKPEAST
ncbi:hypothetical protein DNTS_026866 [Danionella cerebrum]|uniref:SWIM-type domain-containing protein n=1 Tax=Danionella cerebrum TaxID=2873325 RepID=A0A553MS45_9TELE|nr:hypothetical protein DNTS_026866 [Danionella translucida]